MSDTHKDICAICQNDIDYKKSVLTSCNHYFCSTCFFKWMEKKADCPVCRKVFRKRTNYDIEREQEILEELEAEVRDYTSLVEQLTEQAFNIEFKRNSMLKSCYELDEVINKKKEEFNTISNDVNKLINNRNNVRNDIQKNIAYMRNLEIGFQNARKNAINKARKKKQFGLNFKM